VYTAAAAHALMLIVATSKTASALVRDPHHECTADTTDNKQSALATHHATVRALLHSIHTSSKAAFCVAQSHCAFNSNVL
jgi:hypothetical protein